MNEACSPGSPIDRDAAAALLEPLTRLVVRAGATILAINRASMKINDKVDGSPVTEADLAADSIINDGLARLIPGVPVLSEERANLAKPPFEGSFFLIDPLDGTKEFVAGRAEFTVNLALVTNGTPLLGIIGAPALGLIWRGAVARSHADPRTEAFIAARPGAIRQALGSAVKFGRIAEGGADIYPRLAPTSEWDIAAGRATLTPP